MITANDITIIGIPDYGKGLTITCQYNEITLQIVLSEEDLFKGLYSTGVIEDYFLPEREVQIAAPVINSTNPQFIWVGIDHFMQNNLDADLSTKLAAHYINSRSTKPVKP